ncbi:hypothetical protein [Actinokineospora sp. NBRC 105648]|uniref:maleate cis-trans isomerase family protein n=1 Tax=Actinokineospora sp. NBRC 105648 TaxID=3032206 RepID=UPI0024A471F7|nr:hypothetical protein [Actinokineospora sp. NBRC 105648]GLZ43086.1 maleate cis-trans isomerase [Actinokineospora sp. NBRC 105648]
MRGDNWGTRAAIGILVIDKDPVAESEFWSMAPPGVSICAARFESPRKPGTSDYGEDPARVVAESPDIARGLDFLGGMQLDVICVCFTTSSLFGGAEFDASFAAQASERAQGIPVVTAAQASVAALKAVCVSRPYVVVPPWFKDEIVSVGREYFTTAGHEPVEMRRFELGRGWRDLKPWETWDAGAQWEVRPEDVHRQVRAGVPANADGILLAGNGFRCSDAIEDLEADLGLPVITSNQACIWHSLRTAKTATRDIHHFGKLFAVDQ